VPTGELTVPSPAEELGAAVLLEPRSSGRPGAWLLFVGDQLWYLAGDGHVQATPVSLGWRPGSYHGDLASPPPLSWQLAGGALTLAGLGVEGSAQWTEVQFRGGTAGVVRAVSPRVGYLAAAQLGPGRVAAVRRAGIDWLRRERGHLLPWTATGMDLPDAVACFPSPLTSELLVVCRDGWLVRVPVPH
jgi:hypothetical protein